MIGTKREEKLLVTSEVAIDFLGAEAEWKNKWSSRVHPHHWLYIFRDTGMGHALRKAKFDWVPAAKRALLGRESAGSGR